MPDLEHGDSAGIDAKYTAASWMAAADIASGALPLAAQVGQEGCVCTPRAWCLGDCVRPSDLPPPCAGWPHVRPAADVQLGKHEPPQRPARRPGGCVALPVGTPAMGGLRPEVSRFELLRPSKSNALVSPYKALVSH